VPYGERGRVHSQVTASFDDLTGRVRRQLAEDKERRKQAMAEQAKRVEEYRARGPSSIREDPPAGGGSPVKQLIGTHPQVFFGLGTRLSSSRSASVHPERRGGGCCTSPLGNLFHGGEAAEEFF